MTICTKTDLRIINASLYKHASSLTDYLDAAVVAMLWYLYGRSSEAEQLEKSQLCVYLGKWLYLLYVIIT